jgi:hypothetical protein
MTLRGGAAVDGYDEPPPFDPEIDRVSDDYLERYAFDGLAHLDAQSWRHYLPALIEYAIRCPNRSGMVIDGLLQSLRPPDRTPPRLGSLTADQERVVVEFLEHIAFGDEPLPERDLALQVLEERWIPGALYRPSSDADA